MTSCMKPAALASAEGPHMHSTLAALPLVELQAASSFFLVQSRFTTHF
jgi:hypothetical protein